MNSLTVGLLEAFVPLSVAVLGIRYFLVWMRRS